MKPWMVQTLGLVLLMLIAVSSAGPPPGPGGLLSSDDDADADGDVDDASAEEASDEDIAPGGAGVQGDAAGGGGGADGAGAEAACSARLAAACAGAAQRRPLCGSDGLTYASRCHLLRAQCKGVAVSVRHKGPCKESRACWADRQQAQRVARPRQGQGQGHGHAQPFAPRCLDDGSYAPVQCHNETGYCWCVTPSGRPLPNTSRRDRPPNCAAHAHAQGGAGGGGGKKGKTGTRRRSSPGGRKNKKGCGRNERMQFVGSVLQQFRAEYARVHAAEAEAPSAGAGAGLSSDESAESSGAGPLAANASAASGPSPASGVGLGGGAGGGDLEVLEWRFAAADGDGDGFLGRAETAELRRAVRRAVRPKRCARFFPRLCDRDADRRVSREEWSACLGLDFNHESHTEGPGVPSKDEGEWKKNLTTRALLRDTLSQLKVVRRTSSQILQGSMSTRPGLGDDSRDTKEEFEANDCLSDRKTALEEQKSGTTGLYIPECTPDGRYKKVQCYTSTGYCWCVYEDTGIVIPGSSVKDLKPNCDIVPPPPRPMAGCPEPRKQAFLKEFLDYMKRKMTSSKDKPVTESVLFNLNGGSEEAVAAWAFQTLDKNKNKVLERKEWKSFRTLVMSQPQLRRCGKRLPRYCDVNNDQKISLTEWLNCLRNHRNSSAMTMKPHNSGNHNNANRNGTNPLMIYLKAS